MGQLAEEPADVLPPSVEPVVWSVGDSIESVNKGFGEEEEARGPDGSGSGFSLKGKSPLLPNPSVELILVLFPETVAGGEKLPAALLVHLPNIRLLACVLCFIFVDEIHHKE